MENNQAFGSRATMDDLKKQYGKNSWWEWFEETATLNDEPVSIGYVKGPLQIDGDLVLDQDPWAIIIDGDVEVNGTVICQTPEERTSTLIVLGTLQANNLFFSGSARLSIEKETTINGFVVGTGGDSGGSLDVEDKLIARGVLLDSHTPAKATQMNALIMCGEGWPTKPDFMDGDNPELFEQSVLDRGGPFVDLYRLKAIAQAGEPVFNQAVEHTWRAKKGLS